MFLSHKLYMTTLVILYTPLVCLYHLPKFTITFLSICATPVFNSSEYHMFNRITYCSIDPILPLRSFILAQNFPLTFNNSIYVFPFKLIIYLVFQILLSPFWCYIERCHIDISYIAMLFILSIDACKYPFLTN